MQLEDTTMMKAFNLFVAWPIEENSKEFLFYGIGGSNNDRLLVFNIAVDTAKKIKNSIVGRSWGKKCLTYYDKDGFKGWSASACDPFWRSNIFPSHSSGKEKAKIQAKEWLDSVPKKGFYLTSYHPSLTHVVGVTKEEQKDRNSCFLSQVRRREIQKKKRFYIKDYPSEGHAFLEACLWRWDKEYYIYAPLHLTGDTYE